jgi:predicted Rossmann fold nucleotide-binding protein DprA/Smf involved in DNA uptake
MFTVSTKVKTTIVIVEDHTILREGLRSLLSSRKAIEKNPGIDFKSLVKKTGLDAKQVQNALPPLKKAGKIKSEGKGIYSPV